MYNVQSCIGVWQYSLFDFVNFVNFINLDPDIRVKAHIHTSSVNYLDVTVFKSVDSLLFKSFIKPTSNLQVLPKSSFHPFKVVKGPLFIV